MLLSCTGRDDELGIVQETDELHNEVHGQAIPLSICSKIATHHLVTVWPYAQRHRVVDCGDLIKICEEFSESCAWLIGQNSLCVGQNMHHVSQTLSETAHRVSKSQVYEGVEETVAVIRYMLGDAHTLMLEIVSEAAGWFHELGIVVIMWYTL
jgi:hypothetical protein